MTNLKVGRAQLLAVMTTYFVLSSTLFNHGAIAAINQSFNYQGKIVNTNGTNISTTEASCISVGGADTCDFRVSLYTDVSGGTLVWQETKANVEVYDNDGIFNLVLDCGGTFSSCNQNGGPNFSSGELFIAVEFDPSGNADFSEGETFSPRRELTAAPYAFNALYADSATNATALSGVAADSFLRSDTADSFNSGAALTIDGTLDTNADVFIADTSIAFDGANTNFNITGDLSINTNDLFVEKSSGDVFIGGISASAANIILRSDGSLIVNEQGNNSDLRIDGSGPNLQGIFFADASSGYVGVGTTAPSAFLDLKAADTSNSSLRVRTGSTPSSPNEGDIYADGSNIYYNSSTGWKSLSQAAGGGTLQDAYQSLNTLSLTSGEGALSIDAVSANVDIEIGQGSDTGDFRIWDGATNWLLIDEDLADITIGNSGVSTGLALTSGSAWSLTAAGALAGVTTIGSSGDWAWTATTPTITINSSETFTVTSGTDSFTVNTSDSSFGMSDGSNSFTFDLDTGPSYGGNARPTKTITLSPEYPGAVLTPFYGAATDTSISGTMISDSETTPASNIRTYYSWVRNPTSQHFYTVAVRVKLPTDFAAWQTSNSVVINYVTANGTSSNSSVDARIYLEGSGTVDASSTSNANTSWSTISFASSDLDLWNAAGETAVIYLRLGSASGNFARVGDITLNYLASF